MSPRGFPVGVARVIGRAVSAVVLVLASGTCALIAGVKQGNYDPSITTGAGGTTSSTSTGTSTGSGPSKYASAVMADGPIGYWRLGEQAPPKAKDASGHGNDGKYLNGVTLGAPGAIAGDPDTAITFTATGQEVDAGNVLDFPGTQPFSIELWAKPTVAGEGALVSKAIQTAGVYSGYQLVLLGSMTPTLYRGSATAEEEVQGQGTSIAVGQWSHIVTTFDSVNMLLYVNGVQIASKVAIPLTEVAENVSLTFGDQVSWVQFMGSLDEVALYDHALPPARVMAHYTLGTTR